MLRAARPRGKGKRLTAIAMRERAFANEDFPNGDASVAFEVEEGGSGSRCKAPAPRAIDRSL